MKVILASNNANKLREMQQILSPLGWEILRQKDVGLHLEPDENGETFEENSLIKAEAVMKASGLPAIADDSGVEVCFWTERPESILPGMAEKAAPMTRHGTGICSGIWKRCRREAGGHGLYP